MTTDKANYQKRSEVLEITGIKNNEEKSFEAHNFVFAFCRYLILVWHSTAEIVLRGKINLNGKD